MSSPADSDHLERAVDLAVQNVAADGGPFGAVLVTAGGRRFEGANRVTADHDPTAHAEVVALRAACARLGTHELTGAVLYASCEPCPMCLASALWARIERIMFAAGRDDAARAGFDDAAFYEYFESPARRGMLPTAQQRSRESLAPFEAWSAHESRTAY
ncbi:nucleoside deaminase [Brachybacterium sp. AOP43-C2-M15]|uniref:nucleoside deaminase n=1 Tax=Brachybacterium sp. AOP43-C2-M15 TaxID=3457661 RepID=UPI004034A57C